jgi:hypothetical protein
MLLCGKCGYQVNASGITIRGYSLISGTLHKDRDLGGRV